MSVLELVFNQFQRYSLWCWNLSDHTPQTAHIVKSLGSSNTVHLARIGPKGSEPNRMVAIKIARSEKKIDALNHEAHLYSNRLRHLQGSVIPTFYGLYSGSGDGHVFACMVMEYCPLAIDFMLPDQRQAIRAAAYEIHQAGIVHQQLNDGHHIMKTMRGIRIVDFSEGVTHRCRGTCAHPTHYNTSLNAKDDCLELAFMEKNYGSFGARYDSSTPSVYSSRRC